jgi:hypothetical protein
MFRSGELQRMLPLHPFLTIKLVHLRIKLLQFLRTFDPTRVKGTVA